MATDRQLSRNFWLHEFPGWQQVPDGDPRIDRLQETVDGVLQPLRDEFGPIYPTSWTHWRDGTPRVRTHAHGGTVDFVAANANPSQLAWWIYHNRQGHFGRVIDERDHVHLTPYGLQGATGDIFVEPTEGEYVPGVAPGERPSAPLPRTTSRYLRSTSSRESTLWFPPRDPWESSLRSLFYLLYQIEAEARAGSEAGD